MSSLVEIKELIDGIGRSFELYKSTNDARIAALQQRDFPKANELDQKLTKIETDIRALDGAKTALDRLEELESRMRRPGRTADGSALADNPQYTKSFNNWLHNKGNSPADEAVMKEIERKDITLGSNAGGGYALPKEIQRELEQLELRLSPVRRLVRVENVSTSDYHHLLNLRGTTSGWVGETGSRSPSNTPQLRDIVPTWGEIYAYPQISEWSLDDMQFRADQWLIENIADEFSLQEGIAVISGNATNKPTGMLNTTPVTTADGASPLRAAAAYQYIGSVASPFAITPDSLIDLVYTLNSAYRSGATYVMNSNTIGAVRKLKEATTNAYIWQPALAAGQPSTLNGYPVETWENLDDVGAAKFPIAFGNWKRAYIIAQRYDGVRVTRDDVTNPGYQRFYCRRRESGIVLNNDAAKWIRTS